MPQQAGQVETVLNDDFLPSFSLLRDRRRGRHIWLDIRDMMCIDDVGYFSVSQVKGLSAHFDNGKKVWDPDLVNKMSCLHVTALDSFVIIWVWASYWTVGSSVSSFSPCTQRLSVLPLLFSLILAVYITCSSSTFVLFILHGLFNVVSTMCCLMAYYCSISM